MLRTACTMLKGFRFRREKGMTWWCYNTNNIPNTEEHDSLKIFKPVVLRMFDTIANIDPIKLM